LIGALTYISQHGSPVIGGLALMSLGLGMGVPLIVGAMLSSMILPKAGEWMNAVKTLAGLALLALAIWLLQRIIPLYVALILWGALCIVAAILFKVFKPTPHPKKATKLLKLFGIILAIFGAALILNTLHEQFGKKIYASAAHVHWHDINTVTELELSLAAAKQKQQYTLLEFYAYWCTSCKKIEATVFSNPEVVAKLAHFNLLRVDMTDMDPKQKQLLTLFNIYGPPAIILFDQTGAEILNKRVVGDINTHEMLRLINSLHGN
jgi:thiol:disulfide interchange protein DsbD